MISILYIITLSANIANPMLQFSDAQSCQSKAIELNTMFRDEKRDYIAACENRVADGKDPFVKGARMGAYSTIKKYEYCLLISDIKNKPVADGFKECTRIISEDVEAIWPKEE